MQQSKKVNVRYITFTAVMAALVFVFTFTFKIPLGTGYTHLGDMMIFLATWLLGGKKAPRLPVWAPAWPIWPWAMPPGWLPPSSSNSWPWPSAA